MDCGMAAKAERRPALGFIFVTLVLIVLGFGILVPVLPALVTQFEGGSIAQGSHWFGWLVGVFALMQFVASPVLGALSDHYGRRRVILISLAGSAIDYVIMGLAPNLAWLFVARMISGMTAGSLATCNAYIADVTPPEGRARAFGLVGAAFGLGFVAGPALGGLLGHFSLRLPFFVAAGCVAVNGLYGAFVLPESLPASRRRKFSWRRANPVGSLMALRRFRGVFDLAGTYFLYMFGSVMLQSTWVLYTAYRFGWGPQQVGFSLMVIGGLSAFVQLRFVQPIMEWLGQRRGLAAGLLLSVVAFAGYGLAGRGWMIYAIAVVGALGGITGPATQALITRHVPHTEHGAVQGSLAGLASLAGIFAPMIAASSFGACISPGAPLPLPGIAFFEAGVLFLCALALAVASFRADDRVGAPLARPAPGEAEPAG
jgi:DHA1 family tetracycline resistance protein-like MFS transporter